MTPLRERGGKNNISESHKNWVKYNSSRKNSHIKMDITKITELLILNTKDALLIFYLTRLLFVCFYILQLLRTDPRANLSMQTCSPSTYFMSQSPTMKYWGRGVCVHTGVHQRLMWAIFLSHTPYYFLRQDNSLKPKLINWLDYWTPGVFLFLSLPVQRSKMGTTALGLYVVTEDLNWGPYAYGTCIFQLSHLPRP